MFILGVFFTDPKSSTVEAENGREKYYFIPTGNKEEFLYC